MADQGGILDGTIAVTNARHTPGIKRRAHRGRPGPFARMACQAQPGLAGTINGPRKISRRTGPLIPGNAETRIETARRFGGATCGLPRIRWPQVANGGYSAAQGDARADLGLDLGSSLGDGRAILPPRRRITTAAEIRRQKSLGIDNPVGGTVFQHRQGKAVKIARLLQRQAGRLINAQKIVKAVKAVVAAMLENPAEIEMPRAQTNG